MDSASIMRTRAFATALISRKRTELNAELLVAIILLDFDWMFMFT